ncbi:MAG: DinB family protein [Bacteroidota bacterium]
MADLKELIIPEYYVPYVMPVLELDLIPGLIVSGNESLEFYRSIKEQSGDYRYAEGKWSIKEVLTHVLDAERIFSYRALAFSRNDTTQLPGFDQELYIEQAHVTNRKLHKIIDELVNIRATTIDLFSAMSDEILNRTGTASDVEFSVRALGYVVMGHELHHRKVIQSKYMV